MERPGGNLNAYYKVKEANLKRLHAVWFQLYAIMKKAELWRLKISVVSKSACGKGRDEQAEYRGFLGQWKYMSKLTVWQLVQQVMR